MSNATNSFSNEVRSLFNRVRNFDILEWSEASENSVKNGIRMITVILASAGALVGTSALLVFYPRYFLPVLGLIILVLIVWAFLPDRKEA